MKKILVITVMMAACMAMAAENYQFQVGGSPELDLSNISGDVTIVAGNAGEIVVDYSKKDDRFEVDIQQDGDRVIVKVEVPEGTRNMKGGVTFEIVFPSEGTLDVSTVSGNVTASDISGDLRLKTVSGNVGLDNSGGSLKLKTIRSLRKKIDR